MMKQTESLKLKHQGKLSALAMEELQRICSIVFTLSILRKK